MAPVARGRRSTRSKSRDVKAEAIAPISPTPAPAKRPAEVTVPTPSAASTSSSTTPGGRRLSLDLQSQGDAYIESTGHFAIILLMLISFVGGSILIFKPEWLSKNALQPACGLALFSSRELGIIIFTIGLISHAVWNNGNSQMKRAFFRIVSLMTTALAVLHIFDIFQRSPEKMFPTQYDWGEACALLVVTAICILSALSSYSVFGMRAPRRASDA